MRLAHHRRVARASSGTVRERGAVVIEMALVAVLLITLLAGAFDYGMAWRASLAVNEAARAGARTGSSMQNDLEADRSLLLSVQSALSSSGLLDEVERVVVFDAGSTNGRIPSTCITGTTGTCNIFTGAQFRAIDADEPLNLKGCIAASTLRAFCPTDRDKVQISADSLGVWVRIRYRYAFGVLGSSMTIDRQAVMRLEP